MNVFENQTSTRAVVAVVHCYENHAQDSRVKTIGGGLASLLDRQTQTAPELAATIH